PSNRSPVTLFGRARLGLQDVDILRGGCNILSGNLPLQTVSSDVRQEVLDAAAEVKRERSTGINVNDYHQQYEVQENTRVHKSASCENSGSPGLSEHVKKYYRSMNLPILRPLPSLVDLMNSRKRAKRGTNH
ncbi:5' exonuclease Apollo-like, partial [Trifolium medium]|nr:5' exonuclease Apollo-like [Trifolium medium]